jgi:hypothetical protein
MSQDFDSHLSSRHKDLLDLVSEECSDKAQNLGKAGGLGNPFLAMLPEPDKQLSSWVQSGGGGVYNEDLGFQQAWRIFTLTPKKIENDQTKTNEKRKAAANLAINQVRKECKALAGRSVNDSKRIDLLHFAINQVSQHSSGIAAEALLSASQDVKIHSEKDRLEMKQDAQTRYLDRLGTTISTIQGVVTPKLVDSNKDSIVNLMQILNDPTPPSPDHKEKVLRQLEKTQIQLMKRLEEKVSSESKAWSGDLNELYDSPDLKRVELLSQAWEKFEKDEDNQKILNRLLLTRACLEKLSDEDGKVSPSLALAKALKLQDETVHFFNLWAFNGHIADKLPGPLAAMEALSISASYLIRPNNISQSILDQFPKLRIPMIAAFNPNLNDQKQEKAPLVEYELKHYLRGKTGEEVLIFNTKESGMPPLVIPVGTRFGSLLPKEGSLGLSLSGVAKDMEDDVSIRSLLGRMGGKSEGSGELFELALQDAVTQLGKRVIITGHSLGGASAIRAAEVIPIQQTVGTFVFGAPGVEKSQIQKVLDKRLQGILNHAIPSKIVREFFQEGGKELTSTQLIAIKDAILDPPKKGLKNCIEEILQQEEPLVWEQGVQDSFFEECSKLREASLLMQESEDKKGKRIDQIIEHFFGEKPEADPIFTQYIPYYHTTNIKGDPVGDLQNETQIGIGSKSSKLIDRYGDKLFSGLSIKRYEVEGVSDRELHNKYIYQGLNCDWKYQMVESISKLESVKKELVTAAWMIITPLRDIGREHIRMTEKAMEEGVRSLLDVKYGEIYTS